MSASPLERLAHSLAHRNADTSSDHHDDPGMYKQNVDKPGPDPSTVSDWMPGEASGPFGDLAARGGVEVDAGANAYDDITKHMPVPTRARTSVPPYAPLPGEGDMNAKRG